MSQKSLPQRRSRRSNGAARATICSCLVLTLTTFYGPPAAAQAMSYTYIEGGYVYTDLDNVDIDGDGVFIGGSVAVHENVFVLGGFSNQDFDGIDLDQFAIGVGGRWPLSEVLDVTGSLSYLNVDADGGFGGLDDDGVGLAIGLRGRVARALELEGGINYVDFDRASSDTSLGVGGRYYFTPRFALGAGVSFGDDATGFTLGVRYEFAPLAARNQPPR